MVVVELCEPRPAVDAMMVQVCDRTGDTLLEERHSWAVVPRKAAGLGGEAMVMRISLRRKQGDMEWEIKVVLLAGATRQRRQKNSRHMNFTPRSARTQRPSAQGFLYNRLNRHLQIDNCRLFSLFAIHGSVAGVRVCCEVRQSHIM